ncbi:MAG: 6-bladed beta-propeller [Bacteroidales bacterium]|jgi:hypothetical protein|nr:6-bladed beta-propeller [Bacteroidales bacterium]
MKKVFIIMMIGIIAVSCRNSSDHNNGPLETLMLKENIRDTLSADKVFRSVDYITLDVPDSVLMGYPSKIIRDGNKILISDGTKIFVFEKDGRYIRSVSRLGRGPGEHRGIRDFTADGNNIYMVDSNPKLLKYSVDGKFIEDLPLGSFAATVQPLGNGNLVVTSAYQANEAKFKLFDESTLKEVSSYCPVDEAEMKYRQIIGQNNFFRYKGFLLFHEKWNSDVYKLGNDGYSILYHIDFFGKNIPSAFLHDHYSDVIDFSMKLNGKGYSYLLNDYAESAENILMKIMDNGKVYMCLYNKRTKASTLFRYMKMQKGVPAVDVKTMPANFYSEDSMFLTLKENEKNLKVRICQVKLR